MRDIKRIDRIISLLIKTYVFTNMELHEFLDKIWYSNFKEFHDTFYIEDTILESKLLSYEIWEDFYKEVENKNKKEKIAKFIWSVWKENPDWRFWQLLTNIWHSQYWKLNTFVNEQDNTVMVSWDEILFIMAQNNK